MWIRPDWFAYFCLVSSEETKQRIAALEEEYEELKTSYFDKDPQVQNLLSFIVIHEIVSAARKWAFDVLFV